MASIKQVLEGLTILAKYNDPDVYDGIEVGHDIIYCGGEESATTVEVKDDEDLVDERISTEEQKRLDELGWFIDSTYKCWASFC